EEEDGAKVVRVENMDNPYKHQDSFDKRFKLSLNKLYAWSLVDYDRIVMLDADNLFLQNTDELFQCGQFCAVFINPCVFHTGLSVLQLLLDKPMFHPPANGTKLDGTYRLPLGYQMDASYYYLKLRWSVPCGPNNVITFPGALWLKPWYWWYGAEMAVILVQSAIYLGVIAMTRLARPSFSKLCYRRSDKSINLVHNSLKLVALWCILAAYVTPFFTIPHTVHPLLGWILYLLGTFALCSIAINVFMLPMLPVLVPWLGIIGALMVMAFPWYPDGVVRALFVFAYAFCSAPFLWASMLRIVQSLQLSLEREAFLPARLGESSPNSWFNKLY
uniref:Glycogenin glucosyltransferase n=1 Tax=Glycine max TaxID=3847 RepID=K7K504_SOYBN